MHSPLPQDAWRCHGMPQDPRFVAVGSRQYGALMHIGIMPIFWQNENGEAETHYVLSMNSRYPWRN
jgi:hypothetical protein